jgi:hypothetical protein
MARIILCIDGSNPSTTSLEHVSCNGNGNVRLERGTPVRDDTKPSREKMVSLLLGGVNDSSMGEL